MSDQGHLVIFPNRPLAGKVRDNPAGGDPAETLSRLDNQALSSNEAQGRYVFEDLSERDILALRAAGARIFTNRTVNLIRPVETGTPELVPPKSGGALKGLPVHTMNTNTVPAHGANLLHEMGITGEGVNVVIIDTGLGEHSELPAERIKRFDNAFTPEEETPADRTDGHGHGTHVSGTAVGNRGMAPGANIMAVQVLDEGGSGTLASILDGLDRAIQWKRETPDEPMVISMSLGATATTDPENDPIVQKVMEARAEGIIVVVAAGNSGPDTGTVGSPGIAPEVLTVAALDTKGTPTDYSDDEIASFSSRGNPNSNAGKGQFGKPDIAASGVGVTSTLPGDRYATWSGTSMATPAVSGAVALLLSYARKLELAGELRDGMTVQDLVQDRAFAKVIYWSAMNNESAPGHVEGAGTLRVDQAKKLFDTWYGANATENPPDDVEPPWSHEGEKRSLTGRAPWCDFLTEPSP